MRRFIFLVAIVVIVVTVGTIYIGSRTFDGTVVDRPYETGLAWDERQKRQEKLGWRVVIDHSSVTQGENVIMLLLMDRKGVPLTDATVELTLSRPSTRELDRTCRVRPLGNGRYQVMFSVPLAGLWDLRTTVSRGADRYESTERIEAKERTR